MISPKKRILLFAKRPVPGEVKSRLAKAIGDQAAAQVYERLLFKNIKEINNVRSAERWVFASKKSDVSWFCQQVRTLGWRISHQSEGDIGTRMLNAFTRFSSSKSPTMLVGSDIADLSFRDIEHASRLLEEKNTCVLGPSGDGGYWFIGFNSVVPLVFSDIPWSSEFVFERTLERVREAKLKLKILPVCSDIDEIHDLMNFILKG